MELDRSHPAIRLAEHILGDQRWAVTVVTDERVERWPRATEPVGCD